MIHEVITLRDIPYAHPSGKPLLADLYLPKQTQPVPVIVWLHGGGWRIGDRRLAPDLQRFFAQHGFAMVSVDYRLSAEATFPAAVEDVKTAVRWLRSSAGGHLAALAALSDPGLFESPTSEYASYSSEVQSVMDGYGPTNFLQMDSQRSALGEISNDPESIQIPKDLRSAAADSFESLFLGAPIGECPDLVQRANPASYAKAGAPPFLIMHGLADAVVPPQQSELLYEAIAAHNKQVTLGLVPGLGHGFLNRNHLDDGPPRPLTLRGPAIGPAEQGVFERILGFFQAM